MKMGESPREMDKKPSVNNNQITQNVKDLLSSREVENIFENSDFVYMLNQAGGDRQILAKQHTDFFKLLAQFLDVIADNPVINIHIALMIEHIQRTRS